MDCKSAQHAIMPYIEQRLSDTQLEAFLEHISKCETCSEELEVYFTIYYALAKLDQDDDASFDIKKIMKESMEKSEEHLQYVMAKRFLERVLLVLVGIILGVLLVTGVDAAMHGGFTQTKIYQILGLEEETELSESSSMTLMNLYEGIEQETNRKNQVIQTVPETEVYHEDIPPFLPDPVSK